MQYGQHYYGFAFGQNYSAYFFINNTDSKQYCKGWIPVTLIDPTTDFGTWIYFSVSVSEHTSYSTNVCAYKRGWGVSAGCVVLECTMTSHNSSIHSWYVGGNSFKGIIKTMYIWNYPKALNVMNNSPTLGLRLSTDSHSALTRRGCLAFNPNNDNYFVGYCPLCDPFAASDPNTCAIPCPLNQPDDLCLTKCQNDLCVTCTGEQPSDCTVCKDGAEQNAISGYCECIYETHYIASDAQSCLECNGRCKGCTGSNYTQCMECQDNYIPVSDKDKCGSTGVCCFSSCLEYDNTYYLSKTLKKCVSCGTGRYSLDGETCVDKSIAKISSLDLGMTSVTMQFELDVTHSEEDIESNFEILITGKRTAYKFAWTLDRDTLQSGAYSKEAKFNIVLQSTLFGSEILKIVIKDVNKFKDSRGVPFGGPSTLEIQCYSFLYLSDEDSATTSQASDLTTNSSIVSVIISSIVQALSGGSVEAMFCLAYMIQICSMLPTMNLYFPPNVIVMFKALAFVNLNNPTMSDMFKMFFFSDESFTDQDPYTVSFSNAGLGSKNMFMNSPDQLMVWVLLLGAYPFVLFAKYMFSHLGPLCKRLISMEKMYHYNGVIKAFMQTYLGILIASFANVVSVTPQNSADYWSWGVSWVYIAFSIFLIVFSIVYIYFNRKFLREERFLASWGGLIVGGEIKTKRAYHYFYLWTFLLRRMIFSVTVVMIPNYPRVQIFIFISSCIFIFLWHLILQPYKKFMLNFFYVFNEFILIILGFIMILFLDPTMPETQSMLYGWLMIALVVFTIAINWAVILPSKIIEGIASLKLKVKLRDDKVRYQIEKKYLVFESEDYRVEELVRERTIGVQIKNKKREAGRAKAKEAREKEERRLLGQEEIQEETREDEMTLEDEQQSKPNEDYFPIVREIVEIHLDELDQLRDAAEQEAKQLEDIKRARTPLMDPKMKIKRRAATPLVQQRRPMSQQEVLRIRSAQEKREMLRSIGSEELGGYAFEQTKQENAKLTQLENALAKGENKVQIEAATFRIQNQEIKDEINQKVKEDEMRKQMMMFE